MNKLDFEFDGKKYYIGEPSQADINEAELVYKIKFSEATRLGAMTSTEAQKIIEARNLWTSEDQSKVMEKMVELNAKGDELMKTKSLPKGGRLLYEMQRLRDEILRLNIRRNSIMDNTAEAYADDHRIQYYVVACTFNEDDERVFNSVGEYLPIAGTEFGRTCLLKTITLIAHEGKDFREAWPENQWRQKQGLIDEKFEPVKEKMDEFVKATMGELNEARETVKKKTVRRRKTTKKTAKKTTTKKDS